MISDMEDTYDLDLDTSDFNGTFNKSKEIYQNSQDVADKIIQGNESTSEGSEGWDKMVVGSYSGIRIVWNSLSLVSGMITDLARVFGVPRVIVEFVMGALAVAILFFIIYLVFRVGYK